MTKQPDRNDPQFGFEEWEKLSNTDVYLLELNEAEAKIHRVWSIDWNK
ncbi:hypothetical protein [Paenibacillus jamilae]|nr:hypothetical protein [Paenibacillus jamilae]